MNLNNKHIESFALLMIFAWLISCQPANELLPKEEEQTDNNYVTYSMKWDGGLESFEQSLTKSSDKTTEGYYSWKNRDRLFLQLEKSVGYAVYSLAHDDWSVTLREGVPTSGRCKVYFFKNTTLTSLDSIGCDQHTEIFHCDTAYYTIHNSVVSLKASLKPYSARLKLYAAEACDVVMSINQPTVLINDTSIQINYAPRKINLSTSIDASDDGLYYTPFIYPRLTEESKIKLLPNNSMANQPFERLLTNSQLPSASTGLLALPSDDYSIGWTSSALNNNGHNFVNLGLPSGTLWATCNVGASSAEEYGNYYAWGETQTKGTYNWSTYKWCNGSERTMTKYCTNSSYGNNGFTDGKTVLELSDDAARVNMGGDWRMPTITEQSELRSKCTWTWTTQNGINGYKVVGPNGNSIFLPAAGCRGGSALSDAGSNGSYWSSTLYSSDSYYACNLSFHSSSYGWGTSSRYYGFSVRGVLPSLAQ